MSEAEFRDWMHRLTKRYPGISGVCVTGSRVLNTGKRPRARWALWEVVAFLEEGRCYEEVPTDAVLRCRELRLFELLTGRRFCVGHTNTHSTRRLRFA